uniref:Uncharacterized protein n=1 Tax=Romanomermis culicivorax TaxID=13658 RepID=A0A915HKT1_ROMCU
MVIRNFASVSKGFQQSYKMKFLDFFRFSNIFSTKGMGIPVTDSKILSGGHPMIGHMADDFWVGDFQTAVHSELKNSGNREAGIKIDQFRCSIRQGRKTGDFVLQSQHCTTSRNRRRFISRRHMTRRTATEIAQNTIERECRSLMIMMMRMR